MLTKQLKKPLLSALAVVGGLIIFWSMLYSAAFLAIVSATELFK